MVFAMFERSRADYRTILRFKIACLILFGSRDDRSQHSRRHSAWYSLTEILSSNLAATSSCKVLVRCGSKMGGLWEADRFLGI